MAIATTELTPVEQTAFLTEYARALDSRWPNPILGDTLATNPAIDPDIAQAASSLSVTASFGPSSKVSAMLETEPLVRRIGPKIREAGWQAAQVGTASVSGSIDKAIS